VIRAALTRSEGANGALAAGLRAAGIEPLECPLVAVEPIGGPPVSTGSYDWLLLTSRNGVDALFDRGVDGPLPRIAVIGPGTAEALRAHGVEPVLVARRSSQEGLADELPRPVGRVLFAGAEAARDVLVRELGADFVALYRTLELRPERFPDVDVVVLASASAARAFAALGLHRPCVSIGPMTSAEAARLGLDVAGEAESAEVGALVRVVKLAGSRSGSSPS
jgi:uroporphyrinogen III methyltransferase/synthase